MTRVQYDAFEPPEFFRKVGLCPTIALFFAGKESYQGSVAELGSLEE